jgi:hypothetical protein
MEVKRRNRTVQREMDYQERFSVCFCFLIFFLEIWKKLQLGFRLTTTIHGKDYKVDKRLQVLAEQWSG